MTKKMPTYTGGYQELRVYYQHSNVIIGNGMSVFYSTSNKKNSDIYQQVVLVDLTGSPLPAGWYNIMPIGDIKLVVVATGVY